MDSHSHCDDIASVCYTLGMGSVKVSKEKIYVMTFVSIYPHYVAKAEKKGRTKAEVHEVISWLTGYDEKSLQVVLEEEVDFEHFFKDAPCMNPNRKMITGVICGIRVEDIEDPVIQNVRYLDKLIDELAKGKAMEKILRS